MKNTEPGTITHAVDRFLRVQPDRQQVPRGGRERSWDFCFNYFQDHPKPTRDLEMSCLQLGYYLASWGMLRGSSYLFRETNVSHYLHAIKVIEDADQRLRGLDAEHYGDPAVRQSLLSTYARLGDALLPRGGTRKTLVTKVMMGVWGVIPSFDTYFIAAFRSLAEDRENAAFRYPNDACLALLGEFYSDHAEEIDGLAQRFTTIDFTTGSPTGRHLTQMKIIDMFGFQYGYGSGSINPVQPVTS